MMIIHKFKIVLLTLFFALFSCYWLNAQQPVQITGIVVNSRTNDPVAFANVSLAGAQAGTTTNAEGQFTIMAVLNDQRLIVSHINFNKQELLINSNRLTIALEPKHLQLDQVVVSATLTEKLVQKTSKPVNIITNRQVQDNVNSNIVDMLSRTPGFTQVWEYHSPLLLRGMNSNRLLVLKNGCRRIGTFPGGYFGQDLNIYEAKKVEVIKGPGSVIYGSGAISGVINILTPDPFGEDKTTAKILSGYGSNNNEFIEAVSLCHSSQKFGINLHGKWRKTGEYVYADGETAENSQVEDRDFSLTTGYKISEKQQIALTADYHWGDWGKPRGFNGPTKYFTQIRNVEEGLHSSLIYTIQPNGMVSKIVANLYYDAGTRDYYQYKHSEITGKKTSLDLVHYKDNYGGAQVYSVIEPVKNNKITIGADAYAFRIDNPTDYYDYYNNTTGYDSGYEGAGQQSAGVFINDDWAFNEKIDLVAGVRYDWAEVVEGSYNDTTGRNTNRTAISGNLGLVYSPADGKYLSLNVGRAFRMPITEELFTQTVSCKGIKKGNPDLEPEYSWNFDAGFRGSAIEHNLNWEIALFYNIVDGYINESADTVNEDIDFTYKNTDALLFGGEVALSYRFNNVFKSGNKLFTGMSGAYVYGIDKSVEQDDAPLFGIPPLKLLADLKYQGLLNKYWITGYFVSLEGEYAAEQNRVADIPAGSEGGPWGYETSEPHSSVNATLGLNSNSLPGSPKLRFVVKNLFNSNYKPYGSYLPVMGQNFKFLVSFTF